MDKRAAWVVTALLLASPASAETLGEAIAAAYESNPQLAAAHARQEALAETPEQERALARPTLSVDGNGGYDHLGYGKSASLTANVTLPIWTGGRVSSAVRAANGDVAAGEEGLRDTEAAILQGVVSAYAALLYNQQAVEVARVGIERLDTQVAETRARYNLGKATRTDVAQLEAQRSTVDANLADAEGALATAAATYRATVGHDAGTLTAEVPAPATLPASQDEARQAAETANPLLLKQRLAVDASGARIDRAQADGALACLGRRLWTRRKAFGRKPARFRLRRICRDDPAHTLADRRPRFLARPAGGSEQPCGTVPGRCRRA
jgi:outer membrane protein